MGRRIKYRLAVQGSSGEEVIQMFLDIFLVCLGLIIAMAICCLWAKLGGDEDFEKYHPKSKSTLHILHHWMFGLVLFILSLVLFETNFFEDFPLLVYFMLGLGTGLFIDDVMFHNYECYFQRRIE